MDGAVALLNHGHAHQGQSRPPSRPSNQDEEQESRSGPDRRRDGEDGAVALTSGPVRRPGSRAARLPAAPVRRRVRLPAGQRRTDTLRVGAPLIDGVVDQTVWRPLPITGVPNDNVITHSCWRRIVYHDNLRARSIARKPAFNVSIEVVY